MKNRNLPIYFGAIGLIILAAFGWRIGETKNFVPTKTVAPMPKLDGDKAKEYFEQQGLGESLGEAIQAARYGVNWVERAPIANQHGAFGYFRFDEIEVGQTYVFSVRHKFYQFTPQVLTVNEEISKLNFTAIN